MAKIAVYDKFYQSERYPNADIASQALAGSEHEVIGSATGMRLAVQQILNFAGMEVSERPDIVIMGGTLEDDSDYRNNPPTATEPYVVLRRTWLGKLKEDTGQRTTFLLPLFEQDGSTYQFPSIISVGDKDPDPPDELLRQWRAGFGGIAGCVLSRIVETYLPEAGRLGVSVDPMFDPALSAEAVDRYKLDAAQQLRDHIQQLTGEV